jgi:aldehyde dehydrogenase (NAD+)
MKLLPAVRPEVDRLLDALGVPRAQTGGGALAVHTPITSERIAELMPTSVERADQRIAAAETAFRQWREWPAPRRGELVRVFGEVLRAHKTPLAELVTLEAGKIGAEGQGEVQEMIDICDYAVGLSRQLHGLTIASERPAHRMLETWHPLGPVGVISAFNFPVAVWAWNAALAWVCGNPVIWKPSEKTPLTALACQALFEQAAARFGEAPAGLSQVLIGDAALGRQLVDDARIPLVSATGSTAMGRQLAPRLAARFARAILELGGNNAALVCPSADLELTLRAVAFSAMGTAGQRCTTLRRLFVHRRVYDRLLPALKAAYASVAVGDPRQAQTLVGPLIDARAGEAMARALAEARALGGRVLGGEVVDLAPGACYRRPALVELSAQGGPVLRETFAPLLYVMPFEDLDEAIAQQNAVEQGLSSAIFTTDLREAERFLSAAGSDCGIANVNIGTSGAEIGGAFGGEKATGGGRESGSDSWKGYMRRATNTLNYGRALPLAQGVRFDLGDRA